MSYNVAIRNNETGEIRIYEYELEWGEGDYFMWYEGNYSCDCNRASFFWQAGDEDNGEKFPENQPCGDGEAFSVLHVELSDGEQIKIDDEFTYGEQLRAKNNVK